MVDNCQIQFVVLRNSRPIMHPGTAERVNAHADFSTTDGINIYDIFKLINIFMQKIVAVRSGCLQRLIEYDPLHAHQFIFE